MKILLFSGSLRAESFNKKLVGVAQSILAIDSSCRTIVVDLKPLELPVYDADIEEKQGIPKGVKELGSHISSADAIVISSPEYNGSIAGSLKNTIDWISRLKPMPLTAKPILLMGASPGALGAMRALGNSRFVFDALGSYVYPQPFGLPQADSAFTSSGDLNDAAVRKRLESLLLSFMKYAKKLKPD